MGGLNSGPHRSARLHEDRAKRYDALELQQQAKAECWPEGTKHTLAFRSPHTGTVISVKVSLTFTAERFGGRRVWFSCPECPRRVSVLWGWPSHISQRYRIACAQCQRIAYASNLEGPARRWRRQMEKLEQRLGGDPRKIEPPKGPARRTFDRLAARYETYRQKVIARSEAKFRRHMRSRMWPIDPAELRAVRDAYGLAPVRHPDPSSDHNRAHRPRRSGPPLSGIVPRERPDRELPGSRARRLPSAARPRHQGQAGDV
jgi:hypothetical protein